MTMMGQPILRSHRLVVCILFVLLVLSRRQESVRAEEEEDDDGQDEEVPADAGINSRLYRIEVTVVNLAPELGTCLTPVWMGIHDGKFDIYEREEPAGDALERLAEDGSTVPLSEEFAAAQGSVADFVVGDTALCPGENATTTAVVNVFASTPLYVSYAAMILPSNDAFVANGASRAHPLFNARAKPISKDTLTIEVPGSRVLDAGTEVNDEEPRNTAFFGQEQPNRGQGQNGVVLPHPGFERLGLEGILRDANFVNADFTTDGYQVMALLVDTKRARTSVRGKGKGKFVRPEAVATVAQCFVIIRFFKDSRIFFRVVAGGFRNKVVTAIELREGRRAQRGPVVVELNDGSEVPRGEPRFSVRGVIRPGELPNGLTNEQLWMRLLGGTVYFTISTEEYPGGEIRVNFP